MDAKNRATPTPTGEKPAAPPPPAPAAKATAVDRPKEIGGPKGLEPTRYGDWERKGLCVDF
ncbi:MAG: DUF1674 domain-containing protein [Alphaproteobacteria bacterium]|nr:DUF1674 domain-containing protein [Alphaproteobacteria bacterium]